MPFLDAKTLETDPDGLAFLSSLLKPEPEPGAWQRRLAESVSAEPALNTTFEILIEAAAEQTIWARATPSA